MTDRPRRARPPLTLIANSQEWHSRSLESILGPHGHAVLRAYTGKQAIERAEVSHPDLIILDTDLPDRDGLDVCRELRSNPAISAATPIVITSPGHANRQRRLEALKAGAWDFIGSALDGEELPLRLDALVRGKREADRVRDESLLDPATGLYNFRGLTRRAREMGSQAFRQREPFACIVLTPVITDGTQRSSHEVMEALAQVLRESGRTSDAIGVLAPGEFAVIAEGTDANGAVGLAERLARAVSETGTSGLRMAAGYDAVANYAEAPIEPSDMLQRASLAMHRSRSDGRASGRLSVLRYDGQLN